jgi:hypothetical protein
MKRMGSKKGFTPMPPPQHSWQMARGEPPLQRMWSWMVNHTVLLGHRCPYAVDEFGKELHMEHMMADLEMDEGNCYHYWRIGLAKGIWRNGTKVEGRRRLFFCGELQPQAVGPEKPPATVCTYSWPEPIWKQIKDWPEDRRANLAKSLIAVDDREEQVTATLMAAKRSIFGQEKDSVYIQAGVKPNRQDHKKKGETPEEAAERRARAQLFIPAIEQYVQTVFVQASGNGLYNGENGKNSGASLLIESKDREVVVGRSVEVRDPTDLPTSSALLEELKELLDRRLAKRLHDTPSLRLCGQILAALQGAPLVNLDHRISLKWKTITSFGFVLHLARDVGEAWAKLETLRIQDAEKAERQSREQYEAILKDVRGKWQDIDQEDRDFYLQHFPELAQAAGGGAD